MRALRLLARGTVVLAALLGAGSGALAEDDEDARLLAAPEKSPDPERLRRAAEQELESTPRSERAYHALLLAVTRLGDRDLLDDAIERAAARQVDGTALALRGPYGAAILRRARLDDPPDAALLRRAAEALDFAERVGSSPREALALAHARHLLGDVAGARRAYVAVLRGPDATNDGEEAADRAVEGLASLGGGTDAGLLAEIRALPEGLERTPGILRARVGLAERAGHDAAWILDLLGNGPWALVSPRTLVLRARHRRAAGKEAEALDDERRAVRTVSSVEAGGGFVLDAVERSWREKRPLSSFADCAALERDYDDLVSRGKGFPDVQIAWLNNLAFRLREVVSTYAWRGEGRTQGIAEGAPKEVAGLLARCVALYDGAVSLIPKDAADAPFQRRWFYAGVLNDAGLMRHYFLDARDLARAEALYLRAFELTDGAYMDTYFYNLQYLYGFELEGREETWLRLARRAQTKILAESEDGGFVPDERKRDAARRDAEALRRKVEERGK